MFMNGELKKESACGIFYRLFNDTNLLNSYSIIFAVCVLSRQKCKRVLSPTHPECTHALRFPSLRNQPPPGDQHKKVVGYINIPR